MKSSSVLTIFEHDTKSIKSGDFQLTEKEIVAIRDLNASLRKKRKVKSDVLGFEYGVRGEVISIKSYGYVGVIQVDKKCIQIVPKLANDEEKERAIKNLVFLLGYTQKLKAKETGLASLAINKENIFEILIYLFVSQLLAIIRRNIYRQYVLREENFPYIKGKLNFSNHIKENLTSRHKFCVQFDDFCEDNLINQILRYTVIQLMRVSNNTDNQKALKELDFVFSDISYRVIRENDFRNIILSRLNDEYEPVLNLCRIFLANGSVEISSGKYSIFSFVFDMSSLFEEFVGRFIKSNFNNSDFDISLQGPFRYFVKDTLIDGRSRGKLFRLIPDIQLIKKGESNPYLIIDTKYKILDGTDGQKKEGVSQSDLYQVYVYSKEFQCREIVLLYPRYGAENKNIDFLVDCNTVVHIRTLNLLRDFTKKEDINALRDDLLLILTLGG